MKQAIILILALAWPIGAQAQDFWANTLPTITGTDTLSTTLREQQRRSPAPETRSAANPCSIDALSPAEKNALYARYSEVRRSHGQASADAWVKAQGQALYSRMAAQGRC